MLRGVFFKIRHAYSMILFGASSTEAGIPGRYGSTAHHGRKPMGVENSITDGMLLHFSVHYSKTNILAGNGCVHSRQSQRQILRMTGSSRGRYIRLGCRTKSAIPSASPNLIQSIIDSAGVMINFPVGFVSSSQQNLNFTHESSRGKFGIFPRSFQTARVDLFRGSSVNSLSSLCQRSESDCPKARTLSESGQYSTLGPI